jgi:lysophospholipase L1-like esterase
MAEYLGYNPPYQLPDLVGDSPAPVLTTFVPSTANFAQNDIDESGRRSPMAELTIQTAGKYLDITGAGTNGATVQVYVNGQFQQQAVFTGSQASVQRVTLSGAGNKTVRLREGSQYREQDQGQIYYNSITKLVSDASITALAPLATANRTVIIGDSITVSTGASNEREGWTMLVRDELNETFVTDSYGFRSWARSLNTPELRAAQVNRVLGVLNGATRKRAYFALGTNDISFSVAPEEAAGYAGAIVDALHAADPTILIYIQTPILRTDGKDITAMRNALADLVASRRWLLLADATGWLNSSHIADGVHPNTPGHALIKTNFLNAVGETAANADALTPPSGFVGIANQTLTENSSQWNYAAPWENDVSNDYAGGSGKYTANSNATVTLTPKWYGNQIVFDCPKGPLQGNVDLLVDGQVALTYSQLGRDANGNPAYEQHGKIYVQVPIGEHTFQFRRSAAGGGEYVYFDNVSFLYVANPKATGTVEGGGPSVNYGSTPTGPPVGFTGVYNQRLVGTDSRWNFQGVWGTDTGNPDYADSIGRFSEDPNASVSLIPQFFGNRILFDCNKGPLHGNVDILVDGQIVLTYSQLGRDANGNPAYEPHSVQAINVGLGVHTFSVRRSASGAGQYIFFNSVEFKQV